MGGRHERRNNDERRYGPLATLSAHFAAKLQAFDLDAAVPLRIAVNKWSPFVVGIGLDLAPLDADENAKLRGLRDRLADTLQIRKPDHETYGFHATFAYLIRYPTDAQKAQLLALLDPFLADLPASFTLGLPEFCTFENMHHFSRQLYLGNRTA